MTELVNLTGFMPGIRLPDHSILLGTFNTSIFDILKNANQHKRIENNLNGNFENFQKPKVKPKKNLSKINESFF